MPYTNNYLSKVALRFEFEPLTALQENVQVDVRPEFSGRIENIFSHVTGQPTATVSFNVGPTGTGMTQRVTGIQWMHRKNENGTCVVTLAPEFLSIELGRGDYHHFAPFKAEVTTVLAAFYASYQVPLFKRIGLRYINEIVFPEGNPLDWKELIAPDLITAVNACTTAGVNMVRSMHQLHVRQNDSNLVFNYGLHNPDFPNTLARRAFILDYDCSQMEVAQNDVPNVLDKLNNLCEEMFENSIGDGLRTQMGGLGNA